MESGWSNVFNTILHAVSMAAIGVMAFTMLQCGYVYGLPKIGAALRNLTNYKPHLLIFALIVFLCSAVSADYSVCLPLLIIGLGIFLLLAAISAARELPREETIKFRQAPIRDLSLTMDSETLAAPEVDVDGEPDTASPWHSCTA